MIRVLNLGAGVQSSAILLMACNGELPKPDVALFADTGEEPASVYKWLEDVLRPAATAAGIVIETVGYTKTEAWHERYQGDAARAKKLSNIPAFVPGKDGKASLIQRQCTREWKIEPLDRRVKELIGLSPGARWPKEVVVESWLGISGDEVQRMKSSTDVWRRYWHPLVETAWDDDAGKPPKWRTPPLRRTDCQKWLVANGFAEAPRSACTFCPMHGDKEWLRLQVHEPEAFAHAVEADRLLRTNPLRHSAMFVHRSLKPLGDIDFTRQQTLDDLFGDECGGVCGV